MPTSFPCPVSGPITSRSAGDALMAEGFVILRDLVAPIEIAALEADLDPHFEQTPFCLGDFYGARTKRFGRLLVRSPHSAALVQHPMILTLAERAIGPWCDCLQLNLTQATEIHPGALAQFPHRDQDMWQGVTGEVEYLLNVMWPLTSFRRDNGATLLWPGSHGRAVLEPERSTAPVAAVCDPGDAIVFLGSTLHGAGANVSASPRRGLIISYCLGWLKPYENQWLAYPPSIARGFPSDLADLVGYRQHRPNLGNFEGRCPSILLEDEIPSALGAVDALRPDQTRMLSDYVVTQRQSAG